MNKNLQKQMEKFYERYKTIDSCEISDEAKLFYIKKLQKDLEKGFITEEEYNKQLGKINSSILAKDNFISLREIIQEMVDDNFQKYHESILAYENIINSTAQLCNELNLKDSMDIFVVFNFLLWNGYFSKNKEYAYKMSGRKNLFGYFGIDIINGQGVCLNKSSMLTEILKAMNYESYMIFNKVNKGLTLDYRPDIERKIIKKGQLFIKIGLVLFNPLANVVGNHACTLVKKGDSYYAYDPTNLCVFKLDDFLKANIIGGKGNIDIKPYWLSLSCGLDNRKIVEIIDSFKNAESKIQTHDFIEIKNSFESNIELCMKNISLFNDFYEENENNRNKVLTIFRGKE